MLEHTPKLDLPASSIVTHSDQEKAEFNALYERGRELHKAVFAFAQSEHLKDVLNVWLARSPGDRLSQTEIDRYMSGPMGARAPQEYIDDPTKVLGAQQGAVVPVIEEILRKDPAVRSLLNVGVYLGLLDRYLAIQFPEVSFTGIDFWNDLIEANAPLLLPNFKVINGYALEQIEAGNIGGDVTMFFSTATRVKNAELRRYFRSIKSRYIVINEPLFPLPTGEIVNPDDVDLVNSVPVSVYPPYPGDRDGPYPPLLVHNYRALLTEAGFQVIHFRVQHQPTPRMQAVGYKAF